MKKILILFLSIFLFTACDKDTFVVVYPTYLSPNTYKDANGNSAITFSSYSTRAISNSASGTGYDDLKLYCWNDDEVVMDAYHVQYTLAGWAYVGVDNQDIQYFKNGYANHKFIGVIPHNTVTAFSNNQLTVYEVESFTTEDETNTPKEFLYCQTVIEKANYANGATLNFKHGNAKVYLKFTSDDPNTEIIDYCPATNGYHSYQLTGKPFPAYGPTFSISTDDIAYINDRYNSSEGWIGYGYTDSNIITGDLTSSMWDYLTAKYPTITSTNLSNWANYVNNSNMRLIHVEKEGNNLRGWFINVVNTQLIDLGNQGNQGLSGIRVLPAKSVAGDGSDAILSKYTYKANAKITIDTITYDTIATKSLIQYSIPSGKISTTAVASPTTFYAIPNDTLGYTVKVSYKYKGVNYYDSRVFIPANECQWEGGKYYTYVINIAGRGNGNTDPTEAEKDDPTVTPTNEIKIINVIITDYDNGGTQTHSIN